MVADIKRSRDVALMTIGWYNWYKTDLSKKIIEGYEPGFEGSKKYRGLPFVESDGVRVYYRK